MKCVQEIGMERNSKGQKERITVGDKGRLMR